MDWQHLGFDPQARRMALLERIARRRFCSESLTEEAFNFALERLPPGGCCIFRSIRCAAAPAAR